VAASKDSGKNLLTAIPPVFAPPLLHDITPYPLLEKLRPKGIPNQIDVDYPADLIDHSKLIPQRIEYQGMQE
jgi:hypothetical protein